MYEVLIMRLRTRSEILTPHHGERYSGRSYDADLMEAAALAIERLDGDCDAYREGATYCNSPDCESKECRIRAWDHKFRPGEIIRIADRSWICRSYIRSAIEEKAKKTTEECIRRKDAIEAIEKYRLWDDMIDTMIDNVIGDVEDLPAAAVAERARGKWKEECICGGFVDDWASTCSICGRSYKNLGTPNYCPNCGAQMKSEDE